LEGRALKVKVKISYVKEAEGFVSLVRHFASGFTVEAELGIYDLEDLRAHVPDEACGALSEGRKVLIRDQEAAFRVLSALKRRDVEKHQICELALEPVN